MSLKYGPTLKTLEFCGNPTYNLILTIVIKFWPNNLTSIFWPNITEIQRPNGTFP